MAKIRKDLFDRLAEQNRERQRDAMVEALVKDDPNTNFDEATNEVVVENTRGAKSRLTVTTEGISKLKTPEGREYKVERDSSGRISKLHAPNNNVLKFEHSSENGQISRVDVNDDRLVDINYSEDGKGLNARFADGSQETLEYDGEGRLVRTVNSLGAESHLGYDLGGEICEIRNADQGATRLSYDEDGFCEQVVFADGTVESYDFTDDGRLSVSTNETPHCLVAFDDDDEIKVVEYSDGHSINLKTDDGKFTEGSNSKHVVRFGYGDNGLLSDEEQDGDKVEYQYDGEDNLTKLITPSGEEINYEYDLDDLLTAIEAWGNARFQFDYDASGQLQRIAFPNGVSTSVELSRVGQDLAIQTVSGAESKPVLHDSYTYDSRGRVVSLARNETSRKFEYDAAGQLTVVLHDDGVTEHYAYDSLANRTTANGSSATFDAGNRMQSAGSESFDYDARGNLIKRHGNHDAEYEYNGQDHLVRSVSGDKEIFYSYDAFGRRKSKSDGVTETKFVWAGRQLIREVTSRDGELIEERDYLYLPGTHFPLAVRINGEVYGLHTDRLGTVVAMTDPTGKVVWQADYETFGQAKVSINHVRQPIRFLGQYHDEETDLHYNLFRYYDPQLGRYITPDPIRFHSGSLNFYQYADNDPINRMDPEGHIAILAAVGIIAAAAVIGGLIGGAISAAMAPEGQGWSEFKKGFGWGALAGAVGAAVPIVGAAAGLGAAAIGGIALAADAVVGGIEACSEGGSFWKGAGISVAMTLGTLGLAKIPGVKRVMGAVGKKLGNVADKVAGRAKQLYYKLRPSALAKKRAARKAAERSRKAAARAARESADAPTPTSADPPGTYRDSNGRLHDSETGQFAQDPNRPINRLARDNQYPSGFRQSTHETMVARHTDEGIAAGGWPVDANGKKIPRDQLTWRDENGNVIPYYDSNGKTNLTYDHNTPVVEQWNQGAVQPDGSRGTPGKNMSRAERADAFNDPDNLTPMGRSDNSSKGGTDSGGARQTYDQDVGENYSN